MNTDSIIHPEISAAERQVREDQERLARSLDRFQGKIDTQATQLNERKEQIFDQAESLLTRVQAKLDVGVKQIDELVVQSEELLNEKFAQADEFVGQVGADFESTLGRTREIFERVRGTANEAIDHADQTASRIEGVVMETRKSFVESADELLGKVEDLASLFRISVNRGTHTLGGVIERVEEVIDHYSKPSALFEKSPRLGVSSLFFAGIAIGIFFRQFVGHRANAAPIEPPGLVDETTPDSTTTPSGIVHSDRRAA